VRLQLVANALDDLGSIERSGQKVVSAEQKSAVSSDATRVGRHNYQGNEPEPCTRSFKAPEDFPPIDTPYMKVEKNDVWRELIECPLDLSRINDRAYRGSGVA